MNELESIQFNSGYNAAWELVFLHREKEIMYFELQLYSRHSSGNVWEYHSIESHVKWSCCHVSLTGFVFCFGPLFCCSGNFNWIYLRFHAPFFGVVYTSSADVCVREEAGSGNVYFLCWPNVHFLCFCLVLVIGSHRSLQLWLSQLISDNLGVWPAAWRGWLRYEHSASLPPLGTGDYFAASEKGR